MAAFPPSAHALKRAVAAFGEELVPILRLNMAAGHVQATWRKHATRNPVKVRHFVANTSLVVLRPLTSCLLIHPHPIIIKGGRSFDSLLRSKLPLHIRVSSGAWRLFRLHRML